jgi:hypothetical protein
MVHSIYANNNPKLSKFVLYFRPGSVHAHIILWINDIDVDRITNDDVSAKSLGLVDATPLQLQLILGIITTKPASSTEEPSHVYKSQSYQKVLM